MYEYKEIATRILHGRMNIYRRNLTLSLILFFWPNITFWRNFQSFNWYWIFGFIGSILAYA